MADNKKYYYLKLKDNFFDTDEVKILESLPNGIYYSNLLIKLYMKSLKFDGALRFNDFIPYDENMIATITNLNIDIVRSGLKVLASMKFIETLDDGTIYMMNIQSLIGKSSSEADRKRLYREKIEGEKLLLKHGKEEGTLSKECPIVVSKTLEKSPPEIENRDKEIEIEFREREKKGDKNHNKDLKDLSKELLNYFNDITKGTGEIPLSSLKLAIKKYGFNYVKMAIDTAFERDKLTMTYINGILKNWAKEGYPMEGDGVLSGGVNKDCTGYSTEKCKSRNDGEILTEEERRRICEEIL